MPAKKRTNAKKRSNGRAASRKGKSKTARRTRQTGARQAQVQPATRGNNGTSLGLADFRARVREAEMTVERLSADMNQADDVLTYANRQLAVQQEATRLTELSDLGTTRIAVARQIDRLVGDLEALIADYGGVGNVMLRLIPPLDDTARLKTNGQARLRLLLGTKLRDLDIPANQRDPRFGQSLTEMEVDAMTDFLVSDKAAMKQAAMKVAIE